VALRLGYRYRDAALRTARETLDNLANPRDNGYVIVGNDWVDVWQAARHLGLRADHGQKADQAGKVFR